MADDSVSLAFNLTAVPPHAEMQEVPEGCLEWESEKFECFATCEDVEYEVECEVEEGSTEAECYVEDTSSGEKLVEFSCPLNAEMKIECENLSETLNVEMESCLYTSTMKFMDAFVASS